MSSVRRLRLDEQDFAASWASANPERDRRCLDQSLIKEPRRAIGYPRVALERPIPGVQAVEYAGETSFRSRLELLDALDGIRTPAARLGNDKKDIRQGSPRSRVEIDWGKSIASLFSVARGSIDGATGADVACALTRKDGRSSGVLAEDRERRAPCGCGHQGSWAGPESSLNASRGFSAFWRNW